MRYPSPVDNLIPPAVRVLGVPPSQRAADANAAQMKKPPSSDSDIPSGRRGRRQKPPEAGGGGTQERRRKETRLATDIKGERETREKKRERDKTAPGNKSMLRLSRETPSARRRVALPFSLCDLLVGLLPSLPACLPPDPTGSCYEMIRDISTLRLSSPESPPVGLVSQAPALHRWLR